MGPIPSQRYSDSGEPFGLATIDELCVGDEHRAITGRHIRKAERFNALEDEGGVHVTFVAFVLKANRNLSPEALLELGAFS
jgi:hypothetical protein